MIGRSRRRNRQDVDQFDNGRTVVLIDNMKAEKLHGDRRPVSDTAFVETVIWRVTRPVVGSRHRYR